MIGPAIEQIRGVSIKNVTFSGPGPLRPRTRPPPTPPVKNLNLNIGVDVIGPEKDFTIEKY